MLRFLADENLKGDLYRGLFRRQPDLELLRVQDVDELVLIAAESQPAEWTGKVLHLPL